MTAPKHTAGPWFWALDRSNQATALQQSGSGDYVVSPQADIGNYGLSVDCWNDVSEANARLIAAAPDGLEFARAAGGDDGFLLAQIATFIGGWADAARLTGTQKAVAERYYEALHALSEQGRAFVTKATGEAAS